MNTGKNEYRNYCIYVDDDVSGGDKVHMVLMMMVLMMTMKFTYSSIATPS